MTKLISTAIALIVLLPGQLFASVPGALEALQGPVKVGEEIQSHRPSPAFGASRTGWNWTLVWSEELHVDGASYIAPHFSDFELPEGAWLVVRSPDSKRVWNYTRFGKTSRRIEGGFWATHVPGSTAIVELYSSVPVAAGAVVVDRFAHGYPRPDIRLLMADEPLPNAICGADDSEWAKCYQSSDPVIYDTARAVARLLINGSGACTGWLVGDQGHLMTNNHCIGNASDALNTDYEFMAEGATCSTNCATFGGCSGIVEATSGTFIQTDVGLDYTLVKLPASLASTYGFMQLRDTGAVNGERIYIPQHPAAWGKRIAVNSSDSRNPTGFCEIDSLNQPACTGASVPDIGYYCDTQGGSSGSPVLANDDNCVVALHHCANCQNRGVPITAVISDLGGNLPPNAICGGAPPPPPPPPADCPDGSIDFTSFGLTSYSNQDINGTTTVEDGGTTLRLTGNNWKRSTQTFDVGPNTVLEFEFASGSQGEIHAIGFDANDTLNDAPAHFQFWGTQNWTGTGRINWNPKYSGGGDFQTYSIPVGQSYTGTMNLVFTNDNDAGSGNEGRFRCVRIVDEGSPPPPPPSGCALDEDFESGASGWSTSGNCSTGTFVLGTPTQQTNSGVVTQVGGDHTTGSGSALFTATNSSAGNADVDGGECVLTSPAISVSEASTLSAWYFHGQRDAGDDSNDYFRLEMSTNGGSSYSSVVAIGDVSNDAAWTNATANVPAGADVRLRIRVSDGAGPGDLIEAGIDDVSICP